jgi:Cu+-exporting ATPase
MTHVDPVCGMTIDEADAVGTHQHAGVTYYFCHPGCLERFARNPKEFLEPVIAGPPPAPEGATFICPMDPEVRSARPGACPKCGMALEPDLSNPATIPDAPNPELVNMTRRFKAGALLAAPVFVVTMADMLGGGRLAMTHGAAVNWLGLALATPVVFWAGWPFFERAWASLVNRSPNMFTLIGLGVGAAYGYSAMATIAPGVFPAGFRMHGVVDT